MKVLRFTISLTTLLFLSESIESIAQETSEVPLHSVLHSLATHPLDGLTLKERWTVYDTLVNSGKLQSERFFSRVQLIEPSKSLVSTWRLGQSFPRYAEALIRQEGKNYRVSVDVSEKKVLSWEEVSGVQFPSYFAEIVMAPLLEGNVEWQEALKRRKINDSVTLNIGPVSAALTGVPEEYRGRNLAKVTAFSRRGVVNSFGRPITGLLALVDIDAKKVIHVIDEGPNIIPDGPVEYAAESVGELRQAPAPLRIEQPNGPGFKLNGHVVEWQKWRFHFRVATRGGLVISQVQYEDDGEWRSVLYQAHLSELFVPYFDPAIDWVDRLYLDVALEGAGFFNGMTRGLDCPENAILFDATISKTDGTPGITTGAAALFELDDATMAWRHWSFETGRTESRKNRALVLRSIATLGNYDYVFDWVFTQSGSIRVRVGSTGIVSVKGAGPKDRTAAGADPSLKFGRYVGPHLRAVNHDHYFCYRLDFDVDGTSNSLLRENLRVTELPPGSPRTKMWATYPEIAKRESDAKLRLNMYNPSLWRIINPNRHGAYGDVVGYHIKPGSNAMNLLPPDTFPGIGAGFTQYHLWVTPYRAEERNANGVYPLESAPSGLPQWTASNREIENTDIVAWYTMGFHHVVRVEDWPVMPTSWNEFELRPYNFFDRNPALDLPREALP